MNTVPPLPVKVNHKGPEKPKGAGEIKQSSTSNIETEIEPKTYYLEGNAF